MNAKTETRRTKRQNERPTIGLLIDGVLGAGRYQAAVWTGMADAARARDANLICFAGGLLRFSPLNEFEYQHNVLYDMVTTDNVDGLVICGSALANFVSPEELERFYDRYRSLPLVSVGLEVEGAPSVVVDNESGLRDAIVHLARAHGYRRIAFIRGPEHSVEAEQRYRVYTDVLAEHDIPFDPDLIAPGDFLPHSGAAAVRLLLDERKAHFEAVVRRMTLWPLALWERSRHGKYGCLRTWL